MTIDTDALLKAIAGPGIPYNFIKNNVSTKGAGTFHSLWKLAGTPPAGSNPPLFNTSGYVPTRATTGAIGQTDAAGGNNKYIAALAAACNVAGVLMVYDRLWACSGFDTNITTSQVITSPGSLPAARDPNSGFDAEPWVEVYTAPGATGATWTLTGTDSTGTSGRTWTYTHPASAETAGQIAPMQPLTAVGGCRQPASFICSVASGTAGDVGITLVRRLALLPQPAVNVGNAQDAFVLGMPEVHDDACLAFMIQCSTNSSGTWQGFITIPELTP